MNQAIASMFSKYECRSIDDHVNALREIIQEIALYGLWRGKFFEQTAFYGGTALRVLYQLERFSEDMDFSLIAPNVNFDLSPYLLFVEKELSAWGFSVKLETKEKSIESAIESAFLKANTKEQMLVIEAERAISDTIHADQMLKIKIEVDTDPPPEFSTETKFLLQPVPFSVRVFDPPSSFAAKMHATLCRSWKNRVKGRDWYDFVWYVSRGTKLDLTHLEARMRQSGHYREDAHLNEDTFRNLIAKKIDGLDIKKAIIDVERFVTNPSALDVWSKDFFKAVADKILIKHP